MLLFWILDILLTFRTGYYEKGHIIMRPRAIAHRYIRTYFLLELAVVICDTTAITLALTTENRNVATPARIARISKCGRLIRVFGLLRLGRLRATLARVCESRNFTSGHWSNVLELSMLLVAVLSVNHVIACIWFMVGWHVTDTGESWLDQPIVASSPDRVYRDMGFWYQYTTALHFSMAQFTPGSVQVFPVNTFERILNVLCLIFGLVVFTTIISMISSKMTSVRLQSYSTQSTLQALRGFLRRECVKPSLAIDIERHVRLRLYTKSKPQTVGDIPALESLPLSLRQQLMYELCQVPLVTFPVFHLWRCLDETGVRYLVTAATGFRAVVVKDNLFLAGPDKVDVMYHAHRGSLLYTQVPETSRVHNMKTKVVEIGRWLCEAAIWCEWVHVGSVEAQTNAEVLEVYYEGLMKALSKHRSLRDLFMEYAIHFHRRLQRARPPYTHWPDDTQVPFTEFEEIAMSLSGTHRLRVSGPALKKLRTQRWGGARIQDKLEEEVANDQTVFTLGLNNDVLRNVAAVAVHIHRADGRLFVQLGKLCTPSFAVEPGCEPFGTKAAVNGKEPWEAYFDYIRSSVLAPLAPHLNLEGIDKVLTDKSPRRLSVLTRYIRYVHRVHYVEGAPWPPIVRLARADRISSIPHEQSMAKCARRMGTHQSDLSTESTTLFDVSLMGIDIYGLSDGQSVVFCGWVLPAEFDCLARHGSKRALRRELERFEITEEMIAEMSRVQSASTSPESGPEQ
eukprot:NODE_528_length_2961_cov_8.234651.p1 GENE.NODE_528_length_2961_cov_8.234651~~NODE_528_length_2961_cov_8.234651.p1  ORF type:complete len:801 (-),score=217.38 NODE_528_length_2961_cov_8.234651:558-2768(-)